MSNRVTEKDLAAIVRVLNGVAGTPQEPYGEDGGNAGCYHLDYANGGVALVQMMEKSRHGQGVRTIIPRGTKREIYERTASYIDGIRDERNRVEDARKE